MKSNKQRRVEIRDKRLEKIKNHLKTPPPSIYASPEELAELDRAHIVVPVGAVAVNPVALVTASTFIFVPNYYQDILFHCAQCGDKQIWTAKAQKWWYEIAKGNIETTAKYCRPCRIRKHQEKREARKVHFKGIIEKYGLEKASAILKLNEDTISHILAEDELKS